MQNEFLKEKIKQLCGLDVSVVELPADLPVDGILQNGKSRTTVFSVKYDGKQTALEISGSDDAQRALALLVREFVGGLTPENPVKAFLEGTGGIPQGVHVGKSDYYVFAVYAKARTTAVLEYLTTMSVARDFVADMTEGIVAFCKAVDNDIDYRSAGEFAEVLKENLSEEIKDGVKIGVGGVAHGVSELPSYYANARAALVGGAEFDPTNDIYSFKEYALIKTLSALSNADKERYVKTVLDRSYREVLSDTELITAADAFIKHSLNVSEASRNMYVHRNTLIYRLDKIEKMTGLNIRYFNDAMTFRVACLVYKML